MPGRFPLVAVALTGDPFCEDGFCGDPPAPPAPPFDPDIYSSVRWVGTANYAKFDGNTSTDYFVTTPIHTSAWTSLNTFGGVRDVILMINTESNMLPYDAPAWRASGTYTFDPTKYPINRVTNPVWIQKYNPNGAPVFSSRLEAPAAGFWGFSPGYGPSSQVLYGATYVPINEFDERVLTYTGVFQFSNDASTVLATWEGL